MTTIATAGTLVHTTTITLTLNGLTLPPAPTGLAATPDNAQVALTWNASGGATSYNVMRATVNGGPHTTVANVTTPRFNNTGLANGTTYYYVVSAVNGAGESASSAQVSATPQVFAPTAPTGLAAAVAKFGRAATTVLAVANEAVRTEPTRALQLAVELPASEKRDEAIRRAATRRSGRCRMGGARWLPVNNIRAVRAASIADLQRVRNASATRPISDRAKSLFYALRESATGDGFLP